MTVGYSGTPLPKKLGIKPGFYLALLNEPPGLQSLIVPRPEELSLANALGDQLLDVIVLFVRSQTDLCANFAKAAAALQPNGCLWVCWPKKASGIVTDLSEDVIRTFGLEQGLVDIKVCAVDATWSGLKFVDRLADRDKRRSSPEVRS